MCLMFIYTLTSFSDLGDGRLNKISSDAFEGNPKLEEMYVSID